jgi:hypothetical protein
MKNHLFTRIIFHELKKIYEIVWENNSDLALIFQLAEQGMMEGAELRNSVIEECARKVCYGCLQGWPRGYHRLDKDQTMLMHYTDGNSPGEPGHECLAMNILKIKVEENGPQT